MSYETLADGTSLTNVWFRSVTSLISTTSSFANEGNLNRGIAISGNKIYLTGRTAAATDAFGICA